MAVNPEDREYIEHVETQEWIESLNWVIKNRGPEQVVHLLRHMQIQIGRAHV